MKLNAKDAHKQNQRLQKVITRILEVVDSDMRHVERIEILRGTDLQWPCRVHYEGAEDYQGVFVEVE